MLRVWGGGLREKSDFYDICDREGMMVWQELPFACANLSRYPEDVEYLTHAKAEASAIVRDLRSRPCLVLWCAGNEFGPRRNRPLVNALRSAVVENDGTRPFRPASPSAGDSHNWRVWHHFAPLSDYTSDGSAFISEFGLQAPPSAAGLRSFIPQADLWPPGAAWSDRKADLRKLAFYAAPFMPVGVSPDLEAFVAASQQAQARAVQIMVEHARRRKYATSGVVVWQLHEPWPAISWSLIAHSGERKPAFDMLRRVFAPLLVSVEYPTTRRSPGEAVTLRVWVISDLPLAGAFATQSTATLALWLSGKEIHRQTVGIKEDSSVVAATVQAHMPDHEGPWQLTAELQRGEEVLASNEYDLAFHDHRRMPPFHQILTLLGRWLLR